MTKLFLSILILIAVISVTTLVYKNKGGNGVIITTTPQESPIGRIAKVFLTNINHGDEISLPIELKGEAVGNWYFEASFPAYVEDMQGNRIAQGIMQAQSEWMTTEHVAFKGTLERLKDYKGEAIIVLQKDNPSGEARFDEQVEIAITIK